MTRSNRLRFTGIAAAATVALAACGGGGAEAGDVGLRRSRSTGAT